MKIVGIAGSLRKASFNRGLIVAARELLPEGVELDTLEIRLPLYDADLDVDGGPDEVRAFKDAIDGAAAVLIATPEYNYGVPGPLKNAIDWASRPAYKSVFHRKKVAVFGASGSVVGSARAQGQLKQVLLGMASEVFPFPEVVVGNARDKFENGRLVHPSTREHLGKLLDGFVAWVRGE